MIIGYKAFNSDLTNRYGIKFEIGKIYLSSGAIRFGNNGNGFHLCKNIEDTFRLFNPEKMTICKVIGSGNFLENNRQEDEYYGFSEMYAVEKLEVLKKLTRLEIIQEGLKLNELRAHSNKNTSEIRLDNLIKVRKYQEALIQNVLQEKVSIETLRAKVIEEYCNNNPELEEKIDKAYDEEVKAKEKVKTK